MCLVYNEPKRDRSSTEVSYGLVCYSAFAIGKENYNRSSIRYTCISAQCRTYIALASLPFCTPIALHNGLCVPHGSSIIRSSAMPVNKESIKKLFGCACEIIDGRSDRIIVKEDNAICVPPRYSTSRGRVEHGVARLPKAMKGGVDGTKTIVVSSCDSASYRSVLQWSTVATAHRAGSGRCESVRSKEWFVREYLSMTKMLHHSQR